MKKIISIKTAKEGVILVESKELAEQPHERVLLMVLLAAEGRASR